MSYQPFPQQRIKYRQIYATRTRTQNWPPKDPLSTDAGVPDLAVSFCEFDRNKSNKEVSEDKPKVSQYFTWLRVLALVSIWISGYQTGALVAQYFSK